MGGRITIALTLLLFPYQAFGHPMGNFSISHYASLRIEATHLELQYLIDMAEIPTFQEMQGSGITAQPGDIRLDSYLAAKGLDFGRGLDVSLDGRRLALRLVSRNGISSPGAGNLPTVKLAFLYRAPIPLECGGRKCELEYRDNNFPGRAGWKEVVAMAAGGVLIKSSTVPAKDRSASLSNYPTDLLNSPPQELEARVVFFSRKDVAGSQPPKQHRAAVEPGTQSSSSITAPQESAVAEHKLPQLVSNRQLTPRSKFTELMRVQRIGIGMLLLGAIIAAALGALHALEPGHGKTIVAAYLVGSKGTARDAFLLGLIVTVSHTAGVYLLGLITMYAQSYIMPERLYPFLAVLSGALIAGMGIYLGLQRFLGAAYIHSHMHGAHGHHHAHGGFWHSHEHSEHHHDHLPASPSGDSPRRVSLRQLLVLGVTGGIVPCPAALVVLLSAVALHRIGFGLFLIVAFSFGLAAVLIGMGLLAIYAGRLLSKLPTEGELIHRWLPLASAVMITILGCTIAVRGLITGGILQIHM